MTLASRAGNAQVVMLRVRPVLASVGLRNAVIRELAGYSSDEKHICSIPCAEDHIPMLRRLFPGSDEQMILAQRVTPGLRDEVARILGCELDPSLDYLIETFAS